MVTLKAMTTLPDGRFVHVHTDASVTWFSSDGQVLSFLPEPDLADTRWSIPPLPAPVAKGVLPTCCQTSR